MKAVADILGPQQLYLAARARASYGGESRDLARLRAYLHAEMLAGRIDGQTCDTAGVLLDALARASRSKVGDLIGPNAETIPWDVVAVETSEGAWTRAFYGEGFYEGQEYGWIAEGGYSTDLGIIDQAPVRVTRVVTYPDDATIEQPFPEIPSTLFTVCHSAGGTVEVTAYGAKVGAVWGPAVDNGEWFIATNGIVAGTEIIEASRRPDRAAAIAALFAGIGLPVTS